MLYTPSLSRSNIQSDMFGILPLPLHPLMSPMSIRSLLLRTRRPLKLREQLQRRWNSNSTHSGPINPSEASPNVTSNGAAPKKQSRLSAAIAEMKKKPGTHLTSFLLLHEITAIAPLVPMYYFFQWTGLSASFLGGPMVGTIGQTTIPTSLPYIGGQKIESVATEWIDDIARTVARVGSKYGIMGFHKVQQLRGKEKAIVEEEGTNALRRGMHGVSAGVRGKISETVSGVSVKNVMDGVAAYAVVKAILPFRLAISISGTPWFARHIITPILGTFRRKKPAVAA